MRWMVGFVAVAACGGRSGVEIDVHVANTGATSIELWVSMNECTTNTGMPCTSQVTWKPGMTPVKPEHVFTIDDTEIFTSTVDATGTGVFTLTADSPTHLFRVAAIGYDDGMHPVGYALVVDNADVPAHRGVFWTIDLAPTADIDDTTKPMDGSPRVHVWRPTAVPPDRTDLQPPQLAACLAIEVFENSTGPRYEFLLPPDDHDCDNYFDDTQLECKRFQFDYDSSGVDGDCVTTMGSPAGACVLGRSGCTDGSKAFGCSQGSEVRCTIDPICAACGGSNLDQTCLDSLFSSTTNPQLLDPALPGAIECMFPSEMAHQCTLGTPYCTLELDVTGTGRSCAELKFYDEAPPFSNPRSNLVIDQISFSVQPDNMVPCRYYLTWSDGVSWGPTPFVRGLLDFRLDNNNHILVPYQIGFEATGGVCPTGSTNIGRYSNAPTLGMATQCE